jgi:hypothetical protein
MLVRPEEGILLSEFHDALVALELPELLVEIAGIEVSSAARLRLGGGEFVMMYVHHQEYLGVHITGVPEFDWSIYVGETGESYDQRVEGLFFGAFHRWFDVGEWGFDRGRYRRRVRCLPMDFPQGSVPVFELERMV